jgi:hypothetical protein
MIIAEHNVSCGVLDMDLSWISGHRSPGDELSCQVYLLRGPWATGQLGDWSVTFNLRQIQSTRSVDNSPNVLLIAVERAEEKSI